MVIWIIWLSVGSACVIAFTALVIPIILVRLHSAMLSVRAKAVDRTNEEFGAAVTYVPSRLCRQYIKSYRVAHDKDGLFFVGELSRKAAFAGYELTVYNSYNEIIQVLRIKERFNDSGETTVVRLPEDADYVGLRLVLVDDDPMPAERRRFNAKFCGWLFALCASMAIAVDLLVWLVLSFMLCYNGNFSLNAGLSAEIWALLLGATSLVVIFLTCGVTLGIFFLRKRGDVDE